MTRFNRSVLAAFAFAALAMPSAALADQLGNQRVDPTKIEQQGSVVWKDFVVAVRVDCTTGIATDFVEQVITCADEASWVNPAEYGPYVRTAE